MKAERWWIAQVKFERRGEGEGILPSWALDACGWMVALAPDEETACTLLVRDVEHHDLRVSEIADVEEIFEDEVDGFDGHLADNSVTSRRASRRSGERSIATRAKAKPDVREGRESSVARLCFTRRTRRMHPI
jgi:hypothetical protein